MITEKKVAKKPRRLQTDREGFLAHMADRKDPDGWPGERVGPEVIDPEWIKGVLHRAWNKVRAGRVCECVLGD